MSHTVGLGQLVIFPRMDDGAAKPVAGRPAARALSVYSCPLLDLRTVCGCDRRRRRRHPPNISISNSGRLFSFR